MKENINKTNRILLGAASVRNGNGGIAKLARITSKSLQLQGFDIKICSYLDREDESFDGAEIIPCNKSKVKFVYECQKAAFLGYNLIFDSIGVGRAMPARFIRNGNVAVWMCGIEVWDNLPKSGLEALMSAEQRISISKFTLDKFNSIYKKDISASVCWLGTEEDELIPITNNSSAPTALILSRIDINENYKGHIELIEAWRDIITEIPNARLIIAGGGSGLESIKSLVGKLGMEKNILVMGYVDDLQLENIWNMADIFVMPSRGEGFGFVYIEAMRRGKPVIASVHDAGGEINRHGITGFNVNLEIRDDLTKKLLLLFKDQHLRKLMASQAQREWLNNFSFSSFHSRLKKLIYVFNWI